MSDELKVGQWVLIQFDEDPYKIIKIYEKDGEDVVDLDDGDNFKYIGRPITKIRQIPKKNKRLLEDKVRVQISSLLKKYSLTETVRIVHNLTEISKKNIYRAAIEIKNE